MAKRWLMQRSGRGVPDRRRAWMAPARPEFWANRERRDRAGPKPL